MTQVKEENNHLDRIILNLYKPYADVLVELRDNKLAIPSLLDIIQVNDLDK